MSTVFTSKAVRWISFGWTAFIVENVVLSHNRDLIIEKCGDNNYHNIYNTLSTAACGSIAWGYFKYGRKQGPMLSPRSKPLIVFGSLIQILGLIGLSQVGPKLQIPVTFGFNGFSSSKTTTSKDGNESETIVASKPKSTGFQVRCPMDFKSKDHPADVIYGMERVSRHATFWSLGATCFGYALTTVFIPEVVMFSFPLLFAYIGSEHQDYRYRRNSGGTLSPEKDKITSNMPFAAFVRGEQKLLPFLSELKWTNVAAAIGLGTMFMLKRLR